MRLAVGRDRRARTGMGAVRVRAARPDMPLVEMGVPSTKRGRTIPPRRSMVGRSAVAGAASDGASREIRAPSTMMSQAAKRSAAA
jgi:hypothetical protein